MCEKCLYRSNCQFLATHKKSVVKSCTVFRSEADFKTEIAMDVIDEFKNLTRQSLLDYGLYLVAFKNAIAYAEVELKKKYTSQLCTDCTHFVGCECFDRKICDEFYLKDTEEQNEI